MADALLLMAGIRSQPSHASSAPDAEPSVDETTVNEATIKKADVDSSPVEEAAEESPGEPTTSETQSSTSASPQKDVRAKAEVTPPRKHSSQTNRPVEALPMIVGLRLVGLSSPSGMVDPNRSAPRLAKVWHKTNEEADPDRNPPSGLVPSDEKSFGIEVKTGKPAVVIVFDVDRWKARIAGGSPIPITESLLDQARNDLYYCFKNTVGEVIKFARSRRDPTPIQRLVLVVRDEKCLYPGCHAPPDACDAHHINEVIKDKGRTDTDVMGLFCEAHHRHIHLNDLVVKRNLDGSISIIERRTGAVVASTSKRDAA